MPDIVITEPVASLRAKLRLAVELEELPHAPLHDDQQQFEGLHGENRNSQADPARHEKIW